MSDVLRELQEGLTWLLRDDPERLYSTIIEADRDNAGVTVWSTRSVDDKWVNRKLHLNHEDLRQGIKPQDLLDRLDQAQVVDTNEAALELLVARRLVAEAVDDVWAWDRVMAEWTPQFNKIFGINGDQGAIFLTPGMQCYLGRKSKEWLLEKARRGISACNKEKIA